MKRAYVPASSQRVPEQRQKVVRGGEWIDFYDKGDSCTLFMRVPAHVTLSDVQGVMVRFGLVRTVSACGSPCQDGSWVVLAWFYSALEAMEAQLREAEAAVFALRECALRGHRSRGALARRASLTATHPSTLTPNTQPNI